MRKFQETFNILTEIRANVRGEESRNIKFVLGDSINNNRTLTVSQVVRYLTSINCVRLANTVELVTEILQDEIEKARTNRTDAIDINELVNTYRTVVMNKRKYRREIGNAIAKRGI